MVRFLVHYTQRVGLILKGCNDEFLGVTLGNRRKVSTVVSRSGLK